MLRNIYSEWVLTLYSQGTQEIPFELHLFETPLRLMGQWTNSKICSTVTDRPFLRANMSKCTFNPKKEIPYWASMVRCPTVKPFDAIGQTGQPLVNYLFTQIWLILH